MGPFHSQGGFLLDFPAEVMQQSRSTATDPAEVLLSSFISRWPGGGALYRVPL